VVVFVTDGEPNGCDMVIADIAAFAGKAKQDAGIVTFAVGLDGSNTAQLDTIAAAGGTGQAFFVGNGNAEADLVAALEKIQTASMPCTFKLPAGSGDQPVDPKLVELTFTPTAAATPIDIPKVAS